jgi:AGZA family xanthine/uracil permease-like MFS transporter
MHGYALSGGAIINAYGPSHTWPFVLGYGGIAVIFFVLGMRKSEA